MLYVLRLWRELAAITNPVTPNFQKELDLTNAIRNNRDFQKMSVHAMSKK
jgi:hypothetical protein